MDRLKCKVPLIGMTLYQGPARAVTAISQNIRPNTMISGQPAEVMEQLLQTAGHPKATYRVDRAPQESAKVQQGYRESQRSFPDTLVH